MPALGAYESGLTCGTVVSGLINDPPNVHNRGTYLIIVKVSLWCFGYFGIGVFGHETTHGGTTRDQSSSLEFRLVRGCKRGGSGYQDKVEKSGKAVHF
jgi:hypothetical protein